MNIRFWQTLPKLARFDLKRSTYQEQHRLLDPFVKEVWRWREENGAGWWFGDLKDFASAQPVMVHKGESAAEFVVAIAEIMAAQRREYSSVISPAGGIEQFLAQLVVYLLKKRPPITVAQLEYIQDLAKKYPNAQSFFDRDRIASMALNIYRRQGSSPKLTPILRDLHKGVAESASAEWAYKETKLLAQKLKLALEGKSIDEQTWDQPWQKAFAAHCPGAVLDHAATARGTAPSLKWIAASREEVSKAGEASFLEGFEAAVAAIRKMDVPVDSLHSDMLRGLCWMAGLIKTERAAFLLGEMLLACNHKLSGVGARSQKGFTACVTALERFGETYALAELSKAKAKVKTPSLASHLISALTAAAHAQNIELAELEELVVPTFGLDSPGATAETFGDVEAELRIVGTTDVELSWSKDGKPVKSVPAAVKEAHKAEVADLSKRKKEIEAALSAQKARIEALYLIDRSWSYPLWRERHIDHPLLAEMTRRLIWRFRTPAGDFLGIAPKGELIDIEAKPIEGLDERTEVTLWHPLDAGISAVEAWREFLMQHEIRQPFKQAHREVYLLTDAERNTGTYSNRFAAHILKQHQAAALMRTRGWRYALQGYFDSYATPILKLPQHDLEAQFFVEVLGEYEDALATESGIALYVSTDQVRFCRPRSDEAMPLDQVPPKIFSEVLRDVDLFVGVSSVGNDPAWMDRGEARAYGQYWQLFAFGDLSASAETRKAILLRLLPRLALANVSRIEGRFLVVKGTKRTYKIHLGSGNILMEPNDQYLCIVPARAADDVREQTFLPFEGDRVLSLILSKALMLAEDDKIKDPTILSQLRR